MATYKIYKETALPGTLTAHSVYLVAPPQRPDYVEIYVTGASASTIKRVIDQDDVQSLIDSAVANLATGALIVDNIAARNAIQNPLNAQQVFVVDATGDTTVASGAATYIWRASTTSWIKISESESLDVSVTWSAITGKPSSSASDIDDAVTKRHQHTNITQLNKISENGSGHFQYAGAYPQIEWSSSGW